MYAGGGYLADVRDGVVVSAGPNCGLDGKPYSYSVYVEFENTDGERWVTDFDPGQVKHKPAARRDATAADDPAMDTIVETAATELRAARTRHEAASCPDQPDTRPQ